MANGPGSDSNSQFSSFPFRQTVSTMSCAVFLARLLVSVTARPTHLTTTVAFGIWMYTFYIGCSPIADQGHRVDDVVRGWLVGAVLSSMAWTVSRDQIFIDEDLRDQSGKGINQKGKAITLVEAENVKP